MMMLTQKDKMLLAKETQDNINEETGWWCEGEKTQDDVHERNMR